MDENCRLTVNLLGACKRTPLQLRFETANDSSKVFLLRARDTVGWSVIYFGIALRFAAREFWVDNRRFHSIPVNLIEPTN